MTPYKRNFIVGVTVLVALVALGWLILQFGGQIAMLPFGEEKLTVYFRSDSAPGLSEGSAIELAGQSVGRVTNVEVVSDNGAKPQVLVTGELRPDLNLPRNVTAAIRISNLIGGGASLSLEFPPNPIDERLEEGDVIPTTFGGNALVPEPLVRLADQLSNLVSELRSQGIVENVDRQVTELGKLVENLNAVAGDLDTQTDVKQSVANFRQASARAAEIAEEMAGFVKRLEQVRTEALATIDSVQKAADQAAVAAGTADETLKAARGEIENTGQSVSERLVELSKVLNNVQAITAKIDKGEGTAGRLVNDQQLYQSLTQSTQLLAATIEDLQRLIRQWEEEGVTLRLN